MIETADAADFVAAMKAIPAGTAEIILVDAEGKPGLKIAPTGGDEGTISISSKEGLLYLNTLLDNWAACFSNGSGTEYGDYASGGGKSEYVIGRVVGNYNCNGTCNGNTVTNMTTSATADIGKIEAGKTVTDA